MTTTCGDVTKRTGNDEGDEGEEGRKMEARYVHNSYTKFGNTNGE